MSLKLTSRKAKIIETIFLFFIVASISFSFFRPIQSGIGQIGIKAERLDIGDRNFYINDNSPFSESGYESFKGGPLYPNILKGISFISVNIFKQDTTSFLWNAITILISSILTFLNFRLVYASAKILCDENAGILAICFLTFCPYTYFYALSGGITIYTLFGSTLSTFLILKINSNSKKIGLQNRVFIQKIFLGLILIYLSLLRPSGIVFSIIISLIMIILEINNLINFRVNKNKSLIIISSFFFALIFGIDQLFDTLNYSLKTMYYFSIEKGTFMGIERDLIRNKIRVLLESPQISRNIEGYFYKFLWKINDFYTGMIDIRDTHNLLNVKLLSFLMRVSTGTFWLAPLTYIFILGTFVWKKYLLKSGLWITILASFIAISPSLIGVAMSRYYFMFIAPILLVASMTISKIYKYKVVEENNI